MLKPSVMKWEKYSTSQPPSGGCVLKQVLHENTLKNGSQPPSGGCVLKPRLMPLRAWLPWAAAFGRLCVETVYARFGQTLGSAAAFGRLCVET